MLIALIAALALQEPPEQRWLSAGAEIARAMTTAPAECLGRVDPRFAYMVEAGRALFRNPYVFGGEAGEGGLSCQTCHVNGGVNAFLFVDGLSDAPGSVDAASRLLGRTEEDGVRAPTPIPAIAGARARRMHGMEEALGQERAESIRAYIAALDPKRCAGETADRLPSTDLADAARSLRAAIEAGRRGDRAIAQGAMASARAAVGAVFDRFSAADFDEERRRLDAHIRALDALRGGYRLDAESAIADIARALEEEGRTLDARIAGSYYDPAAYAPKDDGVLSRDPEDEF